MSLVINLLTFVLILVCLFLGLLILIQLPKKEAGMGAAFGADATAALFGAGSGNALTSMTKWAAGLFIFLCVLVSGLTAYNSRTSGIGYRKSLEKLNASAPVSATTTATTPINPAATPAPAPTPATPTQPVAPAPAK